MRPTARISSLQSLFSSFSFSQSFIIFSHWFGREDSLSIGFPPLSRREYRFILHRQGMNNSLTIDIVLFQSSTPFSSGLLHISSSVHEAARLKDGPRIKRNIDACFSLEERAIQYSHIDPIDAGDEEEVELDVYVKWDHLPLPQSINRQLDRVVFVFLFLVVILLLLFHWVNSFPECTLSLLIPYSNRVIATIPSG